MFSKDGFDLCTKCHKPFRSDKIQAHYLVHDKEDADKLEESRNNPYSSSSNLFESHAANLDATKNMGYLVRETGKYGSGSSHDRFDDESDS